MGRKVDVAKAARTLGVSRNDIQQLIHDGELITFEGRVDLDELRKRYPVLSLPDQSLVEKTKIIRDSAFAERIHGIVAPTSEQLSTQIRRLKVDLSVTKAKASENESLIKDIVGHLGEMQQTCNGEQRQFLVELNEWISHRCSQSDNNKK